MKSRRDVLAACLASAIVASGFAGKANGSTPFSQVNVGPNFTIPIGAASNGVNLAGESQSTVIAPNTNAACPSGRMLVTADGLRPNTDGQVGPNGVVRSRALPSASGPGLIIGSMRQDRIATFDGQPDSPNYAFVSNDHDLISMPNGDVLLLFDAADTTPVSPEPAWFPYAFRGDFGPGARGSILVWRSTDCGSSFHYVSKFDPALQLDGSCANPQFPVTAEPPPASPSYRYDMGGTDGPLARVIGTTIFLSYRCVGYQIAPTATSQPFALATGAPLDETIMATSTNEGATWNSLGYVPQNPWRSAITDMADGRIAFGVSTALGFLDPAGGSYTIDSSLLQFSDATWGFDNGWYAFDADPLTATSINAHFWDNTIVARAGNAVLGAFPTVIGQPPNEAYGYQISLVDAYTGQISELARPVVSASAGDGFIFHMTTVPCGDVTLLYWTDVTVSKRLATIRGMIVGGPNAFSAPFQISLALNTYGFKSERDFALSTNGPYWYGDYQTAGAYCTYGPNMPSHFTFFPMWIEPDLGVHYAEVDAVTSGAEQPTPIPSFGPIHTPWPSDAPRLFSANTLRFGPEAQKVLFDFRDHGEDQARPRAIPTAHR